MNKALKKAWMGVFLCLAIGIWIGVANINVFSAGETFNWYCMRRKDHSQPQAESNMRFIEEYDGYYADKRHDAMTDEDKVIYLTFDAGYENGNIAKILDVLKEEQVPAAFFILLHMVEGEEALVRRMMDEGHLVCNHTMKHRDMTKVTDEAAFRAELDGLNQKFEEKFGTRMANYYRPPEGKFSEENLKYAREAGYKTIFWSFAYADWDNNAQPSAERAKKLIADNIHNGEVMLLHPTSTTNAAILGDVIRDLKAQGFRFGTLDELTVGESAGDGAEGSVSAPCPTQN